MISDKIKNLFRFIDHLNGNKNVLKTTGEIYPKYCQKREEYHRIKGGINYIQDERRSKLKEELDKLKNTISDIHNTVIIIKSNELKLCQYNEVSFEYHYYDIEVDILRLNGNHTHEDVLLIQSYAKKYIEFRNECKEYCNCFSNFFNMLDRITKSLFIYFDSEKNNVMKAYNDFEDRVFSSEDNFLDISKIEKEMKLEKNQYDGRLKEYLTKHKGATENEFRLFEIQETKDKIRECVSSKENPAIFFTSQRHYENAPSFLIKSFQRKNNSEIAKLENYLEQIESKEVKDKEVKDKEVKDKEVKLDDFFRLNGNYTSFIYDLKNEFKVEKGRTFTVIIDNLKKEGILEIPLGKFNKFYKLLIKEFDRNIGNYSSINDTKIESLSNELKDSVTKQLTPIITRHHIAIK